MHRRAASNLNHPLNQTDQISPGRSLVILLADDDEDDRELLTEAMKTSLPGVQLQTVANGEELMRHLTTASDERMPDVILLDLNMPIKGGQECLKEIRADIRLAQIPVIVYSTSGNQDQIDDMYELGADYYVRKPSSYAALKDMAQLIGATPWSGHSKASKENFILLKGHRYY